MNKNEKIKILIVDDSKNWRDFLKEILIEKSGADIEFVGSVENGLEALKVIKSSHVDIVLLDIEMDIMDGMTALPKMLEINPNVKVIMISNLTSPYAKITIEALSIGAADFIPKPCLSIRTSQNKPFHEQLIDKIHFLTNSKLDNKKPMIAPPIRRVTSNLKLLALGASAGGPRVIVDYLTELSINFEYPILIVQHMPPVFTKAFAEVINEKTGRTCVEAEDCMELKNKTVYVAKGDYHLELQKINGKVFLSLNQKPEVNYSRPSVDVFFESIAKIYSNEVLAIVFSGMGFDGKNGAKKLVEVGSKILVQDEKSSIVWGMPGAIAEAGLASKILSIEELARETEKEFNL